MKLRPTYKPDIFESDFPAKGSRLVYGTSGLGGVWGKVDSEESVACLLYAFEKGITALDTAPSYNNAEQYVGAALKRWRGERPFISTKVGRLKAEGAYDFKLDYSPQGMIDSVRRSLDILGIDNLDLLFLHEPQCVPLEKIDEVLDTLRNIQANGLTKMLGVGGNPTDVFRPYITKDIFEVVSGFCKLDASNISAFDQDIPYLLNRKILYYAASSLHFALLGNRFLEYKNNPPGGQYITDMDIHCAIKVNDIARANGISLSNLSLRYLLSIKEASRVVMGAGNISELESSLSAWNQGALPEKIFNDITIAIT